jgi:transposase
MAARRLSMRKIKEILRLKWTADCSERQIAKSCSIARTTVKEYLSRAEQAGLAWPMVAELDDTALENLLYPSKVSVNPSRAPMPPMDYLYRDLRRKGVTLQLLWYEYKQHHPDGYQYSFFCEQYRNWAKKLDPPLRQKHVAGEKMFVDFAGQTVDIIDRATGEISKAHIFIAVLGASSYTYAEATASEDLPCWINAHIHAFQFFGGVPEIVVPDNLKAGVTSPCRYEPDINPTYQDLAEHYGTTVIPARPRKPRDKAKAEAAVFMTERWILAPLRNHTFFSIEELNQAIAKQLKTLNTRSFKKLNTTRQTLYETIDKPALKPLPVHPYEFALWKKARVNIDYHVEVDRHYYSVPYQLCREQLDVRLTATTIEMLFKNRRVASHKRSYIPGGATTLKEHMPKSHQRYLEWTPSRIIKWAGKNGPYTEKLVTRIMENKPHPEQGFRSALGIIRLANHYGSNRVDNACRRALTIKAYSYKNVKSILKNGLDQQPLLFEHHPESHPTPHHNIRGKKYYREKEDAHAQ